MNIVKSLENVNFKDETVITIGNFDGIHIGHHNIINKTISIAKEENRKSVLFTFQNHPCNFFYNNSVKNLSNENDKYESILNMGIDCIVSIPFDEYIKKIEPIEYIREILIKKLNVKNIVIGHDFRFGKERLGDALFLKEYGSKYGFCVEIVKPIKIGDIRISSTYIRNLLLDGNVSTASNFLGRLYSLSGKVVHGNKIGRTIGFPTINFDINSNLLIPKKGVYHTKINVDNKVYDAATNIGYNPTIPNKSFSVETNIINYTGDLYGKMLNIYFVDRLRDEKKFDSIEDLRKQLDLDVRKIKSKNIFTYVF